VTSILLLLTNARSIASCGSDFLFLAVFTSDVTPMTTLLDPLSTIAVDLSCVFLQTIDNWGLYIIVPVRISLHNPNFNEIDLP
jgi:hypothetical protein